MLSYTAWTWPGSTSRITDRQLDLDPQEAPIVRELYERIVAGSTLVQEARRLNDAGIPTQTGKRWTPSTIGKLLHTPIYQGAMCYRGVTGNMTLSVPQIVSPELWKTALDQLRVNSTRQETKHHAQLRGKIRCRNCDSSYTVSAVAGRPYRYYRCIRSLRSPGHLCRSASVNATALERYVWGECLDLLQSPGKIEAFASDEILRHHEDDESGASQVQRLQKALADQEAAKQRIIRLVHLGKLSDEDTKKELDLNNAEVGRLHGQLSALDSSRSLAGKYIRMLRRAEALVMRIAKGIDLGVIKLEDEGHKRRIVYTLLHGIEVKTIGEGRDRRVEVAFRWLGQEASGLVDPQEFDNRPLNEEGFAIGECASGIKVSRLAAALADQTTHVTSSREASALEQQRRTINGKTCLQTGTGHVEQEVYLRLLDGIHRRSDPQRLFRRRPENHGPRLVGRAPMYVRLRPVAGVRGRELEPHHGDSRR
jgi:hypothetical protein